MHVFGHVRILEQRQEYARESFQKLFSDLFREETKLGHCMDRLNKGSDSFCHSLSLGVDSLKVIQRS